MKVLAGDVGGTTIKLGLVENGAVLVRKHIQACSDRPMAERLEAIAEAWNAMLSDADLSARSCRGIGLALPFLIDASSHRVSGEFGKFPGAAEINFRAWAQERFGIPIALENDLRVALLGEWSMGAAQGFSDVVMIALGTGIGCAAMCDGKLLRGSRNRAATLFGHSTIQFDGPLSRCGNVGCAEDFASTATLAGLARSQVGFSGSTLARAPQIDYETVFVNAAIGDACSQAVVEQSLAVWCAVALNAVIAFDPEILVLGGGVMRQSETIAAAVHRHIATHTPGLRWNIPVVPAALGDDAALIGCERLFFEPIQGK